MQGRRVLAAMAGRRRRTSRHLGLVAFWSPVVMGLCAQLLAPGGLHGKSSKMGPNEIQEGYRDVLSLLVSGDEAATLEALFELETAVVGDERPWKRVEDFWRLKLRTLRQMLDAESLALLKPVIMLHHDANQMYAEADRPFLASHSRIMSVELAEIYADRANSAAAREFSAWVMASLGAMLWQPTSVISSADLFYRAQLVDPSNPTALMGLGTAYERNAKYEKAIEYLGRLQDLDPENSVAALHLALCQMRSDKEGRAEGLEMLRELQRPEYPSWVRSIAYQEMARAQLANEDVESAEETIRRGLRALPGDQQLSLQLALVLDEQRRPKEALGVLTAIEPAEGQASSPRLVYDVWEPAGMQEIRDRLRSDAALGLPVLADKLGSVTPAGFGQ